MPNNDPLGRMMRLLGREISHREGIPRLSWLKVRPQREAFRGRAFYCAALNDPDFVQRRKGQRQTRAS